MAANISRNRILSALTAILLPLLGMDAERACASTTLGAWTRLFRGIDHAIGTNTPGGGGFPELQVIHILRVDLTDPDIRLFTTPRVDGYVAGVGETAGYTLTNFLRQHNLQVAVNANSFFLPGSRDHPSYTVREGTVFNVSGLLVSRGEVVSMQDSAEDSAVFLFATNNTPTFVPTNWPARATDGVDTAVAGLYPILAGGVNLGYRYLGLGGSLHGTEPRTAMGISQDRRHLFLLVIDGRQQGYSEGAYDWQAADWLLRAGAWDGINLDGGGSSCMVMMDSTGQPLQLNRDSASAAYGRERTIGCHFGVFAAPAPGFFNDVIVLPDDTAATITWTTIEPVTARVEYGLTAELEKSSSAGSVPATRHAVLLTHLTAGTRYFFKIVGTTGLIEQASPVLAFTTTNYLVTTPLIGFYDPWRYTEANLDGVRWTMPDYDDSLWGGPSPGLLWVDSRGANADIPLLLNTEMPGNPDTDYPYPTYYLRTRFHSTNDTPNLALEFEHSIDDGAVFYLNGAEVRRLRMPVEPAVISNATLASDYACGGDATCSDTFTLSGSVLVTNLVIGENVLAVEVHNYRAASPDITFGLAVTAHQPWVPYPRLWLAYSNGTVTLEWNRGGFTLQQADLPTGPWMDVPGPVISSPFVIPNPTAVRFFRLHR